MREVGLRVEVSITRGSACEGSACPSAEASRSETAPAEGGGTFFMLFKVPAEKVVKTKSQLLRP